MRALARLGADPGPVLAGIGGAWTFLISLTPTLAWKELPGARLMRNGAVLELPLPRSQASGRDLHWIVRPGGTTDPNKLYKALATTRPVPPRRTASPGRKARR
ncbi:hypothetical protein [Streptomyces roseifaciens]|uniref:hypothetical protein n=1 Tax=Streptomyces roseifaciens TaxID=1488406 RepID=UPI0007181624|nr:hypothetical protein [Streptomyces roseifaciens]